METDTRQQRQKQAEKIAERALGLPFAEREDFIAEACSGDYLLQNEVETRLDLFDSDEHESGGGGEIAVGQRLGRYKIKEKIGAGGMGEVFLAHDAALRRPAAIKVLAKKFARDREGVRRFVQEARAASALNHPNILTVYEIGQAAGRHFIAAEFVAGETLRERLQRSSPSSPLALANVLETSAQIVRALAAAHAAGIVHRDIKPENIMIRAADGLVKILDFGLAKLSEKNAAAEMNPKNLVETNPGVVMGTMRYVSPEQARGRRVDGRSDIFSFGIVLYEMLVRRVPFAGESLNEMWAAILTQEPASIRGLRPELPFEIEEIINRALSKDPSARYQSAAELLGDLMILQKRLESPTAAAAAEEEHGSNDAGGATTEKITIGENKTEVLESPAATFSSAAAGGAATTAPLTNLSENFHRIVGREREIGEIKNLLTRENVRLLTLTGIGGTGKTTLAKAAAGELLAEFSDGVFFIELAATNNAELLASTVALPLGVKEAGGKTPLETLKDYLRERRMLLVLDNFEQLAEAAAAQIAELLAAAPQIKILITSRFLLRLSAEREFVVPPLALPAPDAIVSTGELAEFEAVRLFVERAQNARPNFALTDETAAHIAEICRRLDGLPLAIELAAARVKILSPRAILAKLENRLQLLTGGARDLPARQQTMRGAVEWSYELLNDDEKLLFRLLAVFAGGFTFEAAEAVCENYESLTASHESNKSRTANSASRINALDGIASLVDKSLLVAKEQTDGNGGETRLRMLEVVREYALEALEQSAATAADAARRSHAAYFLALAEQAEPHLQVSRSAEWLDRLEEEHDNLRAALDWSLSGDARTAVRLAVAARRFWFLHSHLTEGRRWLEAALARGDDSSAAAAAAASPAERFKMLDALGTLARFEGDYETARRAYERALSEGRETGDRRQIAEACSGLGLVVFQQGDLAAARRFIEEGLAISRETGNEFNVAASLNSLGDIARAEDDFAAAREFFEESLAISRRLGHKQFVGTILTNLGAVTYCEGDFKAAREHFREAIETARELGHRIAVSYSLDGFAALAAGAGQPESAARLAGAAEALRDALGFEIEPADRRFRDAYLDKLRARLSPEEFDAACERGRRMKLKEAVAAALASA